jgi:hypothetical protein
MAITYKYSDYELKTIPLLEDLEKVVIEVRYTYTGTNEEGITSPYPGRTILPSPNPENFKTLEEITEEEVISWLEACADLPTMKRAIELHIEQQSGVIYKGNDLPWVHVEEPTTPMLGETIG